jgi:hypothetical protein
MDEYVYMYITACSFRVLEYPNVSPGYASRPKPLHSSLEEGADYVLRTMIGIYDDRLFKANCDA